MAHVQLVALDAYLRIVALLELCWHKFKLCEIEGHEVCVALLTGVSVVSCLSSSGAGVKKGVNVSASTGDCSREETDDLDAWDAS